MQLSILLPLKKYDKKKDTKHLLLILSGVGRKNKLNDINVIKLYDKSFYSLLPKGSYFKVEFLR